MNLLNKFFGRIVPERYEQYAAARSTPESGLLAELAEKTRKEFGNASVMQVGHLEGAFLKMLIKISGAKRILEIGTFTGYSALAMAEGLPEGGALLTLDIDERATAIAKEYWSKSPHGKKIKLVIGPARDIIPSLTDEFDLVFIDADKKNYLNYWSAVVPKVRQGGLIIVDNVLWSAGNVITPKTTIDQAIAEFNDFVVNDSRVETAMLTIRDGITLAIKK